jgi:hypothetical protein
MRKKITISESEKNKIREMYGLMFEQTSSNQIVITGSDLNDLRNKLKTQTNGMLVDVNTAILDIDNLKVTINKGQEKIKNFSLIFSNVSEKELDLVYQKVRKANPTVEYIGKSQEYTGSDGTIYHCLLIVIR